MGIETWVTTQNDIDIATRSLLTQAEAFGVDITDQSVLKFIQHEAKVQGSYLAQCRFLQKTIHSYTFGD